MSQLPDLILLDLMLPGIDGCPVELTFTEFEMLRLFLKKSGVVFTRQQIVNATKGADCPATERVVDVQTLAAAGCGMKPSEVWAID